MKKIDDKSIQLILHRHHIIHHLEMMILNIRTANIMIILLCEQYVEWMVDIFKEYQRILKDKGVVAF
jgi:hypothetical protein